jgi:hypothetical protein
MSVVTQQSRRRWAIVAAGVAVLLCLPVATSAARSVVGDLTDADRTPVPSAQVLIQRALASVRVPHSGLAESTGSLGLPDLSELSDVAAALGGTTRTRVWWAGEQAWRVDVLSPTGEHGIYDNGGRNVLWDYEQARQTEVLTSSRIRLPRADDLLPPQAARRLLAGVGPGDRVQALPERRSVAGRSADGLRIVPGDQRSTITRIDIWLDHERGLPVAIEVIDARGVTALRSKFIELSLATPKPSVVQVPSAPGVLHDVTDAPDLATRIERFNGAGRLPESLGGVTASEPIVGGTATYGTGLVKFVALPLPGRLGNQVFEAARTTGGTELDLSTTGDGMLISSGLVNLVVARGADWRSYLIVGPVSGDLLISAAKTLIQQRDRRPR